MINVSDQLLEESKENQNYYVTANVTLADGTTLTLKKEDFYLDGNGIVDSADSSDFPIGVAIEKTATLSLVNDENQFSGYSFNHAVFVIYMNLELSDGKIETFKRGSFIVCKKPAIDAEIDLTLLDYMSKTDRNYDTNLTFPCTAGEVLRDCCQTCGIAVGDATFKNSDFRVMKKPTGTTHRDVIGMVAVLAGGNARIDENDLMRIVTYQSINTENFSGVELIGMDDVEMDIDKIVVTGVKYTADNQDYIYGKEGYMIDLKSNQLLSGNELDGVNRIGDILDGFEILPFSLSAVPIGYATFGDVVKFEDSHGNIYYSYATDVDLSFADSTTFSCKAKSVENQDSAYPSGNRVLVEQAKAEVLEKMTAYDVKLKQMNELAANTLGFYFTIETLSDGSTIVYRHDRPTLKESKIIYKNGIDGFFLSVDGGETWKSGWDSNGDATFNILYAIGIQGEYINTRGFTAKDNDGNITFRINADTGEVEINGSSVYIGEKRVDEMLKDMDKAIADAKNMTLQLSNTMQTVTSDADGNIPTFPTVTTTVKVMYGSADITKDCNYIISKSDSVSGSWNPDTYTYTVTGLTADNGWVDIKATYLLNLSITRRFSVSKQKAGSDGIPGRTYMIEPSCNVLKRSTDNTISPNFIQFKAYYRDGDSATRTAYKGRFVIEETTDGNTWNTIYTSSADEDTVTHYLYTILTNSSNETIVSSNGATIGIPRDVTNVRCKLHASGGTTTLMDMQSVAVVEDIDALTSEEILNLLTQNGQSDIFYKDASGKIYISATAIRTGVFLLGGAASKEGYTKILDGNNKVVGLIDKDGTTYLSNFSETSTVIKYEGINIDVNGIHRVSGSKDKTGKGADVEVDNKLLYDFNKNIIDFETFEAKFSDTGYYQVCPYEGYEAILNIVSLDSSALVQSYHLGEDVDGTRYWYANITRLPSDDYAGNMCPGAAGLTYTVQVVKYNMNYED